MTTTPPSPSPDPRPDRQRSGVLAGALIMLAIGRLPRPTARILATVTGYNIRHVRRTCNELVDCGVLERWYQGETTLYRMAPRAVAYSTTAHTWETARKRPPAESGEK